MKYFFFDIDGTLTDNKTRKIVPSAKIALEKLIANGHFVAIATGRAHYKSLSVMHEMGLTNMVCAGGNALVVNNKLIKNTPLDFDKALAIINEANDLGYGVLVAKDDSIDVYSNNTKFLHQSGFRKEPTKYFIDDKLDYSKLENIFKMYVSIPKENEHELTLKDTLGNLRFEPEYLLFQPDNKKQGIIDMVEAINGSLDDVVVFGDDYNDLDMFNSDFYKIAMGNACEPLKQQADYVTDKNVDDGIYNACKKHGWI